MTHGTLTSYTEHACRCESCKHAAKKYARVYRERFSDIEWRAKQRKYEEHAKPKQRDRRRRERYGLSRQDFLALRDAQHNRCAICGEPPGGSRSLDVDHAHATNKIRGLLCRKCNNGLGYFDDCIEHLETAIAYLKKGQE